MIQKSTRGVSLFCLLLIAIGLVAVGSGGWLLIKSIRSEHWPVTDGIILSAGTKSHSDSDHGTTYSAEVTYSYQVAGVSYTGDKVAFGQMSSSSEYANGIVNRYPAGKKISVYYLPGDPSEAVLETGIHGGTWICLAVGIVFTLAGLMFLQISRAAARAQLPGAPQSSSVVVEKDGRVTMDKPPVLMGVIFLLVGIGISFVPADNGKPGWLMYAIGGMFAFGGLLLLSMRFDNKIYSKILTWVVLALFLVIFHWVSFGAGERIGTVSTPFSLPHAGDVRTPFAIFTIVMDLLIAAGVIHGLFKKLEEKTGSQNPFKLPLTAGLVLLMAIAAIFFVFHRNPAPDKNLAPMGESFVSTPIDDDFWIALDRRRSDKYRKQLAAAPPALVVRESHYAFNTTNGMNMHYGWLDDRLANLHITFSELVMDAYGVDYTHTEFPAEWTHGHWTNCYDVIVTVTNQPREALQSAAKQFLRQQYGLAWHLETRDTKVLVLHARDPQLLQSKATSDFARSKSIPEFTRELENYFGEPVIDETAATNRYDKAIGAVPSRWINGRSTDMEFNNQFLATVGLELVATHKPQQWLVMDR